MGHERTEIEDIPSRKMTDVDRYYEDLLIRNPAESTARIEDTAKFLLGITSGTSGLYLSAYKLAMGKAVASGISWFLPFMAWAISIIFLVLVIFPQKYDTFKNEPDSLKRGFLEAMKRKYNRLCAGTIFFVLGILLGVVSFLIS